MENDKIISYLKNNLSDYRFKHTMGVAETARKLAQIYHADQDKAYSAGLLHDCVKEISLEDMKDVIGEFVDKMDEVTISSKALLHGPAAAWYARNNFSIDNDIFDAIYFHTTGKANMSMLTKIVYIADYIEPGRKFDGVEKVRETAYSDIDKAIIIACSNVIVHTVNKGGIIHPYTVEARNYLLLNNRSAAENEKICK